MGAWMLRAVAVGIIGVWAGVAVACNVAVWRECRAAGHSRIVCARWVSR